MIKKFTAPWIDSWNFFKNPKDLKDPNQKIVNKLRQLLSIFILDIFIVSAVAMLIVVVEEAGFVSTETHMMNDLMESLSPVLILFMGVILAPLFEELIFRLYLRKRYNPIRLISFITGVIRPSSKEKMETTLDQFWHKYYKIFFYTAALIFAIIHITNYEMTFTVLLFIPLLTAPQFIAGLFMGYLRVRFGLLWGMLLHVLHNFIFLGIGLLFLSQPLESFYVENADFKLTVEESGFNSSNSMMNSFNGDTIVYENVKFKTMMAQLLDTEEVLIDIHPETVRLQNISFNFVALTDDLDPKETILNEIQNAFDFKVMKNRENQESWAIIIEDKQKLYQYLSDSLDTNSITIKMGSLELDKVNLKQLSKTLNSKFDEFIYTDLELRDQFKFDLQKKDFETLRQELNIKYGLQLEKTSKDIEKIVIEFQE